MTRKLFRQEVLDHSRERLWGNVIVLQPLSFTVLSIAITLIAILVIALLLWGNYARKETVTGYLTPDQGLAKVYAKNEGVVTNILVKEGQLVKAGDPLLTVSTGRSTASTSDVDAEIISELKKVAKELGIKKSQQQQLSILEEAKISASLKSIDFEIDQLKQQVSTSEERYLLSEKRLRDYQQLNKKGHISNEKLDQQYELLLDHKFSRDEYNRQLLVKKNKKEDLAFQLQQIPMRLAIAQSELDQQLSSIQQQILNIESQRSFTLHAPSDGRVTALQSYTGQSIKRNMPVLAIMPEGASFEAELFVPTRAIGFVQKDQKVVIRYTAFPYQRYGLYQGNIVRVSEVIMRPDELPVPVTLDEPVYRVTVSLNQQQVTAYGQSFPLQAGMLLEGDIILENLSLLDWLLDPIYSLQGR
ncbi:HlyD family secretion protein [Pleionea litopenaei]|uniref:HlyD family efflux transporter periplasmic adaptor subunit n=1 Tax=Pleionea litopenaei TaxID=3070815 RepID=A0AA51X5Q0_9GAMM|nr:HlyD family efflux transporter periplasmic adaptor subunit [Pleionea sp. HL-JVS1]WMS86049.1 HlyD family efflux transporter periplasmic adaptor subunit [Pleionea sp. HL-JVS1]